MKLSYFIVAYILSGCSSPQIRAIENNLKGIEQCLKDHTCSADEAQKRLDLARESLDDQFRKEVTEEVKKRGKTALQELINSDYLSKEVQTTYEKNISSTNDDISCIESAFIQINLIHYYVNKAGYDFVPTPEKIHEFKKDIPKADKKKYLRIANQMQRNAEHDLHFCKKRRDKK